eukprot:3338864-Rhodomonas_salina.3
MAAGPARMAADLILDGPGVARVLGTRGAAADLEGEEGEGSGEEVTWGRARGTCEGGEGSGYAEGRAGLVVEQLERLDALGLQHAAEKVSGTAINGGGAAVNGRTARTCKESLLCILPIPASLTAPISGTAACINGGGDCRSGGRPGGSRGWGTGASRGRASLSAPGTPIPPVSTARAETVLPCEPLVPDMA